MSKFVPLTPNTMACNYSALKEELKVGFGIVVDDDDVNGRERLRVLLTEERDVSIAASIFAAEINGNENNAAKTKKNTTLNSSWAPLFASRPTTGAPSDATNRRSNATRRGNKKLRTKTTTKNPASSNVKAAANTGSFNWDEYFAATAPSTAPKKKSISSNDTAVAIKCPPKKKRFYP